MFDPWVPGKIPWRTAWQPTPMFLPREFHGQRSLAGYSPWSHKESDTTEQLSMHTLLSSTDIWQALPVCQALGCVPIPDLAELTVELERERMKPVVKQPSAWMSMMGKYAGWIQPGNSTGPGGQDTCCWHPSRNEHGTGESMREEGEGTVFLAEGTAMGKGLEVGTS